MSSFHYLSFSPAILFSLPERFLPHIMAYANNLENRDCMGIAWRRRRKVSLLLFSLQQAITTIGIGS